MTENIMGHRGTHTPFGSYTLHMGACAHGDVTIHSFGLSLSCLNNHYNEFTVFTVILHILQFYVL